jgi:hypothetical protein
LIDRPHVWLLRTTALQIPPFRSPKWTVRNQHGLEVHTAHAKKLVKSRL